MPPSLLTFYKSSYSNPNNCVEIASWHKSSYSQAMSENCLEFSPLSTSGAAVRDSKYPSLGYLPFTAQEWDSFLSGLKRGEFEE